jgi:hypothetical protein
MEIKRVTNSVICNRCAGCALENLTQKYYALFSDGSVYVFCPECAPNYFNIKFDNVKPIKISEEVISVLIVMKS